MGKKTEMEMETHIETERRAEIPPSAP